MLAPRNFQVFYIVIKIFVLSTVCFENKLLSDDKIKSAQKYLRSLESLKDSWIDPYDMMSDEQNLLFSHKKNGNAKSDRIEISKGKLSKQEGEEENIEPTKILNELEVSRNIASVKTSSIDINTKKQDGIMVSQSYDEFQKAFDVTKNTCMSSDSVFLLRWIKMFLSKLDSQLENNSEAKKIVNFPMTYIHYRRLNSILEQKAPSMIDVESVFHDLLSNITFTDEIISWNYFSDQDVFIITELAVVLVLLLLIAILLGILLYYRPILTSITIVIFVSVVFQCIQMYSDAVAKNAAYLESIDYHTACKQSDFGFFHSVRFYAKSFFISSGSCHDYYKAIMVNPLTEVNLLKAVSLTFSKFVFAPLEAFAQTGNVFLKELLSDLSFSSILFLGFFLLVILLMTCNYRLRLPFFASIEPCAPVQIHQSPDVVSKRKISKLISKEVKQLLFNKSQIIEQNDVGNSEQEEISLCSRFEKSLCLNEEQESIKFLEEDVSNEMISTESVIHEGTPSAEADLIGINLENHNEIANLHASEEKIVIDTAYSQESIVTTITSSNSIASTEVEGEDREKYNENPSDSQIPCSL